MEFGGRSGVREGLKGAKYGAELVEENSARCHWAKLDKSGEQITTIGPIAGSYSFSVKLVCEWTRAGAVEYPETADRRLELASILLSLSLSSRSARNP